MRECLRIEPDLWQLDVLGALTTHGMVALKACKGPGKTCVLAWAVWWWLATRAHCNIIVMSITGKNLQDNLWSEMARWQKASPFLAKAFNLKGDRVEANGYEKTWWCSARSFPQDADKTQQANTLAGLHGKHPMAVLDEVGDYPEGVVVAAEGIFANDVEARLLVAGNPTRSDGPLGRIFEKDRQRWFLLEITGDPDDPRRAPRVSIDWARQQIALWGADSDFCRVNIFGKFPKKQADKLLGPDDCQAAATRVIPVTLYQYDAKVLGVDVARSGDDRTVITLRQGRVMFKPKILRVPDLMVVCGVVADTANTHKVKKIFVDQVGMGAGVVDRLREVGYVVEGVEAGGGAYEPQRFRRKRDELWWKTAEWVKGGGCIPDDPDLIRELCAPTHKFGSDGRVEVESKTDMKKRLGMSPDIADSLCLTFSSPVPSELPVDVDFGDSRGGVVHDYNPFEVA